MTYLLNTAGYEQTKQKLAGLAARRAAVLAKPAISEAHRRAVLASYADMIRQYRKEIKLYEAYQEHAALDRGS